MSGTQLTPISDGIAELIERGDLTGAVTAVAVNGKTVHFAAQGLADLEAKTPMPEDAIFRMMSSTKPVAGVAVMQQVERGNIDVDAPVNTYIPEFRDTKVAVLKPEARAAMAERPDPADEAAEAADMGAGMRRRRVIDPALIDVVPAARDVLVRDLLTHTSGLMSGVLGSSVTPIRRERGDTLATFIPRLGNAVLDFQPGSRWAYSASGGIDVLGRIVEITSGQPFDVYLRENVFEPLGMVDTFFSLPEDRKARLLPLYRKSPEGGFVRSDGMRGGGGSGGGVFPATYFSGSGGLVSTCADYLRFEQMLVNGGELDGVRVMNPETVKLMATNQVGNLFRGQAANVEGLGFGFTVQVVLDAEKARSARSNGAFGWGGAYGTISWADPGLGVAAVYMVQQRDLRARAKFERVVRAGVDSLA